MAKKWMMLKAFPVPNYMGDGGDYVLLILGVNNIFHNRIYSKVLPTCHQISRWPHINQGIPEQGTRWIKGPTLCPQNHSDLMTCSNPIKTSTYHAKVNYNRGDENQYHTNVRFLDLKH